MENKNIVINSNNIILILYRKRGIVENNYKNEMKIKYNKLLEIINSGDATTDDYLYLCCIYCSFKGEPEFSQEEMDKYQKMAIQLAEKDIYNNIETAKANNCLAQIYGVKKDYENALFYINCAIELEPDNARFYDTRATIYEGMNQPKNAKIDYQTIKKINPVYYEKHIKNYHPIMNYNKFPMIILYLLFIILFCFFVFSHIFK